MAVSTIPGHRAASADRVRLLTHNVWGREGRWEDRRRVLIAGVAQLKPDLVTLQESILTDAYDQTAEVLGGDFRVVHSRVREENGSGIAIGSRWPIANVRELDLKVVSPRTDAFACTTQIAEIQAPPPVGPLLVVNHFPDYQVDHEYERERQTVTAARAVEAMQAANGAHVLLAGDLDAEPDAASLRFLSGKQSLDGISVCYRNAWDSVHPGEPGHTFTPQNPLAPADWPFRRIDHIFVRCGPHGGPTLRTSACELAFGEPIDGVWASDHFGLVADLALPSPSGARP